MTDNQAEVLKRFLLDVFDQMVMHDALPAVILAYPAEDGDDSLFMMSVPTLDDKQTAHALKEALLAHCAAKGIEL